MAGMWLLGCSWDVWDVIPRVLWIRNVWVVIPGIPWIRDGWAVFPGIPRIRDVWALFLGCCGCQAVPIFPAPSRAKPGAAGSNTSCHASCHIPGNQEKAEEILLLGKIPRIFIPKNAAPA